MNETTKILKVFLLALALLLATGIKTPHNVVYANPSNDPVALNSTEETTVQTMVWILSIYNTIASMAYALQVKELLLSGSARDNSALAPLSDFSANLAAIATFTLNAAVLGAGLDIQTILTDDLASVTAAVIAFTFFSLVLYYNKIRPRIYPRHRFVPHCQLEVLTSESPDESSVEPSAAEFLILRGEGERPLLLKAPSPSLRRNWLFCLPHSSHPDSDVEALHPLLEGQSAFCPQAQGWKDFLRSLRFPRLANLKAAAVKEWSVAPREVRIIVVEEEGAKRHYILHLFSRDKVRMRRISSAEFNRLRNGVATELNEDL